MKVSVLASGSKGNSCYIETSNHKILIDVGISYKELSLRLSNIGIDVSDIDSLFITHSHSDHIKGLNSFMKNSKASIYMSDKTALELSFNNYISVNNGVFLDDVKISSIILSHDVECVGYIMEEGNSSLVYITDTGYINERYFDILKNKTIYIFESNHDIEMNLNSRKPEKYRKRVISDIGHLSNNQAAYYLEKIVGDDTKYIILAHLSEEDNKEELALSKVSENIKNKDIRCAYQHKQTDLIEV